MGTAKNVIIKSKIQDIVYELMVKTNAANVYVDDTTTLASKLSSIIADIATKANASDLTNGLAGKADKTHTHAQADVTGLTDALAGKAEKTHSHAQSEITGLTDALAGKANASHTHAQSEITGLTDALALLATSESVTSAIDALRQEMLGDTPVEAYNTFTELAAYIAEHKEAADALTAAVGNKADKATTLAGYGITDAYTKTEVDEKISDIDSQISDISSTANSYMTSNDARVDALTETVGNKADKATTISGYGITDAYTKTEVEGKISDAISAATGGVSAADVNTALTNYKTSNDARVDALEADTHTHSNKTVLDGIAASDITAWNNKGTIYFASTQPAGLTEKDLWVQILE